MTIRARIWVHLKGGRSPFHAPVEEYEATHLAKLMNEYVETFEDKSIITELEIFYSRNNNKVKIVKRLSDKDANDLIAVMEDAIIRSKDKWESNWLVLETAFPKAS